MIYLLGATGYVGSAFARHMEVQDIPFRPVSRTEADYTDRTVLGDILSRDRPAFVLNAAGYTGKPNVDACELDKANCLDGNAVFPGMLADVCNELEIPWGHVSSGCIFSGRREDGQPFEETDAPNFSFRQNHCSFYSGTKALGEETIGYGEGDDGKTWVHTRAETGYIWRLRIPFSHEAGPRNYLSKLMHYDRLLEAENSISQLDEFVGACLALWQQSAPYGIYNVTNPGSITTREVVELIQESPVGQKHLAEGKSFAFFEDETEFMRKAARTPRSNCVLSSAKLSGQGIELTPVAEAVRKALENWEDGE